MGSGGQEQFGFVPDEASHTIGGREVRRPTAWRRLTFAGRTWALLSVWMAPLALTLVVLLPLLRRLRHPTILGDDVIRIVDLINLPFDKHLFRPFGDHVAPGFQLVSWLTWEAIGHDIRLAPLGFTIASVTAWVFVLVLLGFWLKRETGSRTATLVALAVVAQSPLVLETAWWYSSSSFSWAVAGILIAVLGASRIGHRPRSSLLWIGIGSALGPAGTTLGILAVPLAILRAALQRGPRAELNCWPPWRRLRVSSVTRNSAGWGVSRPSTGLACKSLRRSTRWWAWATPFLSPVGCSCRPCWACPLPGSSSLCLRGSCGEPVLWCSSPRRCSSHGRVPGGIVDWCWLGPR